MIDPRIIKIKDAAVKLFIRQGYGRTQIGHIAKKAGISVGAVYTFFTSKEALFKFVLYCSIKPDYLENDIKTPIDEDTYTELLKETEPLMMNAVDDIGISKNPNRSFLEVVSAAYDIVYRYNAFNLIVENNFDDCGIFAKIYSSNREKFFNTIHESMSLLMKQGKVRNVDNLYLHTRLIVETISWWGMHLWYDAYQIKESISPKLAKDTCMDALTHAYKS